MKAAGVGLEDFVEWVNLVPPLEEAKVARLNPQIISEPAKESEEDISSVVAGFTARIRKQAASAQRETTPGSTVSDSKCSKRLG